MTPLNQCLDIKIKIHFDKKIFRNSLYDNGLIAILSNGLVFKMRFSLTLESTIENAFRTNPVKEILLKKTNFGPEMYSNGCYMGTK